MPFGNLDQCQWLSLVIDYYIEVVEPVFFVLYCSIGELSKGHSLLLVYLQWVLIYGELYWKSVCVTQVYLNRVTT